ncbi:MAG: hypothetical protein ACYCUG_00445 [Acidimicrobiales bacterium]
MWARMALVVAGGLAYGAGTQYLGATAHWGWAVSALSAPWLALPFLAGCAQLRARRGALAGLVVTGAALAGYIAMIVSPVEGVHVTGGVLAAVVRSQLRWELAGATSGPLLGWLGWRWRAERWWAGPAVVVAALCLEPLDGQAHLAAISGAEVLAGVAAAALVAVDIVGRRRRPA